jgi:hypothetical protein
MHRSCAARYFLRLSNSTANTTNKKSTYPCPACKQEWKKDDVNSILKANKVNEENDGRQSNRIVNKKQRTSRTTDHNNSTNNRSIRSSNRRIVNESDDDDDE